MKAQNYVPILGNFGVGGPYQTGFNSLDPSSLKSQIAYFRKDDEPKATAFAAIASRVLSQPIKTKFVDPLLIPKSDQRSFIIMESGLDLQLFLGNPEEH